MLKRKISSNPVTWLLAAYSDKKYASQWREIDVEDAKEYFIVRSNACACEYSLYSALNALKALLIAKKDIVVTDIDLVLDCSISNLLDTLHVDEKTMQKYDFLSGYYSAGLNFGVWSEEKSRKYTESAADKAITAASEVLDWALAQLDLIDPKYRASFERQRIKLGKKNNRKQNTRQV